jgi:hypothetical protein
MKKILVTVLICAMISACSGATDGDASTDTTDLNVDTALLNPSDTAGNINTNTGTYSTQPSQKDSFSSSGTNPDSRRTTPGTDSGSKN